VPDPLVELLRAEECSPLLSRLRKKVQRGETLTGRCRLSKLTREKAAHISELTGANHRGAGITVDLDLFAQIVVNTGRFDSLESLVQLACGEPLPNLRAARDEHSAQWQQVWEHAERIVGELSSSLTQCVDAEADQSESFTKDSLNDALVSMRKSGWLCRLTSRDPITAASLLDQAFALLKRLPVHPVPLSVFAATHCGSAHALDDSTSLGRIMLKLLAKQTVNDTLQKKAVKRRQIWESVGIVTDELSSTVLTLNLPATGHTLTDRLLQDHQRCGMPVRLTFRHLRLHRPTFTSQSNDRDSRIYICENPSILAEAANRIGANCPPMVCVEGQPSLACWVLLEQLCSRGFRLAYHGDFDWGGIRIANKLYAAFGFEPWRFTSASHRIRSRHHRELRSPEAEAWWDRTLSETIRIAGVSVEEESAIEELLADLTDFSRLHTTTNEKTRHPHDTP
jgi:uncharacterized protein (TIGR02679 family)